MSATNFAKLSSSIAPRVTFGLVFGGLAALTAVLSETGSNALRFFGVTGGTLALIVRGTAFTRVVAAGAAFPLVVLRGSCESGGWTATSFGDLPAPRDGRPRDRLETGAGTIPRMALHASSACEMMEGEHAGSCVRCAWTASQRWSEARNSDENRMREASNPRSCRCSSMIVMSNAQESV